MITGAKPRQLICLLVYLLMLAGSTHAGSAYYKRATQDLSPQGNTTAHSASVGLSSATGITSAGSSVASSERSIGTDAIAALTLSDEASTFEQSTTSATTTDASLSVISSENSDSSTSELLSTTSSAPSSTQLTSTTPTDWGSYSSELASTDPISSGSSVAETSSPFPKSSSASPSVQSATSVSSNSPSSFSSASTGSDTFSSTPAMTTISTASSAGSLPVDTDSQTTTSMDSPSAATTSSPFATTTDSSSVTITSSPFATTTEPRSSVSTDSTTASGSPPLTATYTPNTSDYYTQSTSSVTTMITPISIEYSFTANTFSQPIIESTVPPTSSASLSEPTTDDATPSGSSSLQSTDLLGGRSTFSTGSPNPDSSFTTASTGSPMPAGSTLSTTSSPASISLISAQSTESRSISAASASFVVSAQTTSSSLSADFTQAVRTTQVETSGFFSSYASPTPTTTSTEVSDQPTRGNSATSGSQVGTSANSRSSTQSLNTAALSGTSRFAGATPAYTQASSVSPGASQPVSISLSSSSQLPFSSLQSANPSDRTPTTLSSTLSSRTSLTGASQEFQRTSDNTGTSDSTSTGTTSTISSSQIAPTFSLIGQFSTESDSYSLLQSSSFSQSPLVSQEETPRSSQVPETVYSTDSSSFTVQASVSTAVSGTTEVPQSSITESSVFLSGSLPMSSFSYPNTVTRSEASAVVGSSSQLNVGMTNSPSTDTSYTISESSESPTSAFQTSKSSTLSSTDSAGTFYDGSTTSISSESSKEVSFFPRPSSTDTFESQSNTLPSSHLYASTATLLTSSIDGAGFGSSTNSESSSKAFDTTGSLMTSLASPTGASSFEMASRGSTASTLSSSATSFQPVTSDRPSGPNSALSALSTIKNSYTESTGLTSYTPANDRTSSKQTGGDSGTLSSKTTISENSMSDTGATTTEASKAFISSSSKTSNGQSSSETVQQSDIASTTSISEQKTSISGNIGNSAATTNWLPYSLVTASAFGTASYQSSFDVQATATLPQVILPSAPASKAQNYSQITVGFKRELNYPFLIENSLASAQIFSFLPGILTYPFMSWRDHHRNTTFPEKREFTETRGVLRGTSGQGDGDFHASALTVLDTVRAIQNLSELLETNFSDVAVNEILPLLIPGDSYISSIAVVYFPTSAIDILQKMVLNNNSKVYSNPDPALKSLSLLIDPTVPLTGLIDSALSSGDSPSGSSGSSEGGGGSSTGGSNSDTNKSGNKNGNDSGALDGYGIFHVTFSRGERLLIFLPVFLFFLAIWVLITLAIFGRMCKLDPIRERFDHEDKKWNADDQTVAVYFMPPFHRRPSHLSRDLEKYLDSSNPVGDTSSSETYDDGDLVPMGNNMIFSKSTGLFYQIDEDGNFYFAGTPGKADFSATSKLIEGNSDSRPADSIVGFGAISDNQPHSVTTLKSQRNSELDELNVDDEGNVELSVLDFERLSLDENNTDTFESYNNQNYYKLNQFLSQLSDAEDTEVPAHPKSTEAQEIDTSSNSNSKPLPLSSDSSNLMGQLSAEDENLEEYFYSEDLENGASFDANGTRHIQDGRASTDLEQEAYDEDVDDADDVEDLEFESTSASSGDEDEDDGVNDVHVGEFDELDEVIYRRLSSASGFTGELRGSSSLNTFGTGAPIQYSDSRLSYTRSLSATSEQGLLETAIKSMPTRQNSGGVIRSVHVGTDSSSDPPERPPRPSSMVSFAEDSDADLSHLSARVSAIPAGQNSETESGINIGSRKASFRSSQPTDPEVPAASRAQEGSKSVSVSRPERSKRASFRQSVVYTLHNANIFHGSGRKRSSTVDDVGPRGHTKDDLHKIQISRPIRSENSLGWADN
ncbi:LAME_0G13740g1_1 [Lachancea meyersii CBS 8951]|uniref:LAME_0G13740g1_1 n=1 Tax=Lachancea meyersii CBS 8951 TaxID=1266667 RepID=A0A1G4KA50_9SACH|nr:LAME_0G13740g1_1 [Lachancea meyersii CBS 8951]